MWAPIERKASSRCRGTGEFYLLTDYAEGTPYADDLRRIARTGVLEPKDSERLDRLVDYLVDVHRERLPETTLYTRSIRDLLGSGEGIFGMADGYPEHTPGLKKGSLHRIERACLEWRWRIKHKAHRLVRIHGDFHPFNVLFKANSTLAVLDASRGSAGDAADDVTAMAVNFVFFSNFDPKLWKKGVSAPFGGDFGTTTWPNLTTPNCSMSSRHSSPGAVWSWPTPFGTRT